MSRRIFSFLLVLFTVFGIIFVLAIQKPSEFFKQKVDLENDITITNCNIVDVKTGTIIPNQNIHILNGKIHSIDTITSSNSSSKKINGAGKYIMPALWDMHMHTISLSPQLHFPLLIAHGVTYARDMGDGDSWISDINDFSQRDLDKWQKMKKDNNLLMPSILASTSYHVEEIDGINDQNFCTKIKELISKLKERNESFVKIQLESSDLSAEMFYEIQKQAKYYNLPVLGHLSPGLDIDSVLIYGFKSIEHAWALIPYCVKNRKIQNSDVSQKIVDLQNQDSTICNNLMKKLRQFNVYYTPTHVTSNRKEFMVFDKKFCNDPNNKYIETIQLTLWDMANWLHRLGYDEATDVKILKDYYLKGLSITNIAQKNGVKILAGTDAIYRNVYYGISLHEELAQLVQAGLSTTESIQTATINAAEYFNLQDQFGSIEVGKTADFILLSKNPLDNIRHTTSIETVYFNQRLYDNNDLNAMKDFVNKQSKSFSNSCKFIWNMVKRN